MDRYCGPCQHRLLAVVLARDEEGVRHRWKASVGLLGYPLLLPARHQCKRCCRQGSEAQDDPQSLGMCSPFSPVGHVELMFLVQDKTYVDESWVGESPQNHQWDPDRVQLVPRFRTLIDIHYPGTKLAISEWSSTNDQDITGGLVTADALGIFGKYKVDAATYWYQPDEMGPVGLAFWLYRGYGLTLLPASIIGG